MNNSFNICDIKVEKGTKFQGYVKVLDTEHKMPVTIINGENEGKTILITSGIHACEYPCIRTAIELGKEINPKDVSGKIIIIHPVNLQGFKAKTSAIIPEDKKNINRMFPGNENGTISEKIAYLLTTEFHSVADFYIDIHGGDLHENLYPYVYYPGIGDEEVIQKSKEIAEIINVNYMVRSSATTGSYNSAAINGTPSILIERGGCGLCKKEDVINYKKDVLNVLASLDVLKNKKIKEKLPLEIQNVKYVDSLNDGCLEMLVSAGDKVKKGEKLAIVTDFFGNVIDEYYSEFNCVVLYHTVSLAISKDESLIAYGEI